MATRIGAVVCAVGAVVAALGYYLNSRPMAPEAGANIGAGILILFGCFILFVGAVVLLVAIAARLVQRAQFDRKSTREGGQR